MVAAVAGRQSKRRSCARIARDDTPSERVGSKRNYPATPELHATHAFLVRKRGPALYFLSKREMPRAFAVAAFLRATDSGVPGEPRSASRFRSRQFGANPVTHPLKVDAITALGPHVRPRRVAYSRAPCVYRKPIRVYRAIESAKLARWSR
jgi:hypothetical protein